MQRSVLNFSEKEGKEIYRNLTQKNLEKNLAIALTCFKKGRSPGRSPEYNQGGEDVERLQAGKENPGRILGR